MRINHYKTRLNEDGEAILVKESHNYSANYRLDNPNNVYDLCTTYLEMQAQTEEYVYCLYLTSKCRLIGLSEISHGTNNTSLAQPREIYRNALLCNASCVILVHNHPSGDSTPSREDLALWNKLRETGKMLGLEMLDSIIIGQNNYSSLRERG